LRRRERAFWLVLGAIYIVGLIALIPAHGEICKEGQKAGEEACTSYSLLPFALIKVGQTLDALSVAITAMATIAIAWFTWSLWRSTDKLWVAGERQIELARETSAIQSRNMQASIAASNRSAAAAERALTDLERPWVFVFGAKLGARDEDTNGWFVEYQVANYGKMPAILNEAAIGFEISDNGQPPFPLAIMEDHSLFIAPILAAGEARTLREYFPLQEAEDGSISFRTSQTESGEPTLLPIPPYQSPEGFDTFFRVAIKYRGPQSCGHETAAVWLCQPSFDFVLRGGEAYNFNR
jgi:hypothetical protein